ncbi:ABC transporter substrate-binding protein [Paenibacillus aurantiacus]|uniref:ABC transporter substrate-binding protein n=1 Tax=Paenibacillus aurantiacus TaxID=1936118 RepID=A0ABV5KMU3_9BACL
MKGTKLVLTSAIAMMALAGCGSNADNTESGANTPINGGAKETNAAEGTNNSGEKVTIKYYNWDNGANQEKLAKIIANFEQANPTIDVESVPLVTTGSTTDFYKKLDLMAASGDPLDVIAFSHVDFVSERAARGVLAPLDELLMGDSINVDDAFYMTPKYDGKVYGLQDISSPWLVAINKKALDAAGLPVPTWGWTWDDFRDYAKKMTTGEGDAKQYGAFFHTWGEYANPIAYSELPHPYLTKDRKPAFGDKSFADFFNLRRAMEKEDHSAKSLSDTVGAKLRYDTEFLNGKAAMIPIATFIVNKILDTTNFPHDFQTVFAPLPASSKEVAVGTSYIGGHYLSVGESSEHKAEAYAFIKYMATQTDVVVDFPGSKAADKNKVMTALVGDKTNLVDLTSLGATAFDPRIKTVYEPSYSTSYSGELKTVLENGLSAFLLDDLTAEEAQKQMTDEANAIIAKNTK